MNENAIQSEGKEFKGESCAAFFYKSEFNQKLNEAKFFVLRSANMENILISRQYSEWATTRSNEAKLNEAFNSGGTVFLIFIVAKIPHFQGIAVMTSLTSSKSSNFWKNAELIKLGGCFKLQWITYAPIAFNRALSIRNAFSDNQPVFLSRDCVEIDPKAGKDLCMLFDVNFKERSHTPDHVAPENNTLGSVVEDSKRPFEGDTKPIFDILYRYIPQLSEAMRKVEEPEKKEMINKLSRFLSRQSFREVPDNDFKARKVGRDPRERERQGNNNTIFRSHKISKH